MSSPILTTLNFPAATLFRVSDFLHFLHSQGSSSCPPQDVGPSSRTLGALSPVSPPSPCQPSRASPGRACCGSRSLWPAVHCSPPPTGPCPAAVSPSDHASLPLWHRGLQFQGCTPAGVRHSGASATVLHILPLTASVLAAVRCEAPLRASTGSGACGRRPGPLAPCACLGRSICPVSGRHGGL